MHGVTKHAEAATAESATTEARPTLLRVTLLRVTLLLVDLLIAGRTRAAPSKAFANPPTPSLDTAPDTVPLSSNLVRNSQQITER